MITIIHKDNKESKYIFPDGTKITVEKGRIVTPDFIIGDMNLDNAEIITVADADMPEEWKGCKYKFDKTKIKEKEKWALNDKFTEEIK